MFSSSNELIHFVFANAEDFYYGEDLTRLSLDQYLWMALHENEKYTAVYFLRADEKGKRFSVHSFGDRKAQPYSIKKRMRGLRKGANEQAEWIRAQLRDRRGETAAFVCPIEDFCTVTSNEDWEDSLREIAEDRGRTGILVLTVPTEAERSASLLLNSPAFLWLKDTAVMDARLGERRMLFRNIIRQKGTENCALLNTFSEDHLRGLLRYISVSRNDRYLSQTDFDKVLRCLSAYLRSGRTQRGAPLFEQTMPAAYLRFRDIADQLIRNDVWDRLIRRSLQGTIPEDYSETEILPFPGKECCAGKCIRRLYTESRRLDLNAETETCFEDALRSLMTPINGPENAAAAEALENISKCFGIHDAQYPGHTRRILLAISCCCDLLDAARGSDSEQRAVELSACISGFTDVCGQQLQLETGLSRTGESILGSDYYRLRDRLQMLKDMRVQYEQIIDELISSVWSLTDTETLENQLRILEDQISNMRAASPTSDLNTGPETDTAPEPPAEDQDLSWLYGMSPPKKQF